MARESEPQSFTLNTFTLPLGTTITINNLRNDWSANGGEADVIGIQAYSDPNGDGIYNQWIFDFENNPAVVPLKEEKVAFLPDENGRYSYAAFLTKDNSVGLDTNVLPSSVTITTDYLSKMFGPNTLVLVQMQIWTAVSTDPLTAFQTGTTGTMAYLISDGETAAAPAETGSPAESETPKEPEAPEKPAAPAFTDVAADTYYAAPVAWAVEQGVTTGTGQGAFSPDDVCSRGQIVTFLHRALAE